MYFVVWGMADQSDETQILKDGNLINLNVRQFIFHFDDSPTCMEIDMMLVVEKGVLIFKVVSDKDIKSFEMNDLPENTKHGWVPCFDLFSPNIEMRVSEIPDEWFSRAVQTVFSIHDIERGHHRDHLKCFKKIM